MDFWQKAQSFAEEAAKRSQEITKEAAKKSQELTKGAAKFSQEFVSETAKKSKELAVEATKTADLIKVEALKRADQIKTLAEGISPQIPLQISTSETAAGTEQSELEKFGVTDELREFVRGITISTFQDFPMEDEPEMSEVPAVSNVRQDLTQWEARHATLVLSTVKEISRLRYELCPRHMKERKFWRIYFILVNSHVALYEKRYNEEPNVKALYQDESQNKKENPTTVVASKVESKEVNQQNKTSSSADHDLDVFLLGDLGSSDEGPDDDDGEFDDDFDKIVTNSALESDGEAETTAKL
ncbi:protein DOS2-like isoform X2 [Aristolochia californica]|uniref:protein DOS2-like isoform X2 n=1 Tax=Aristolochia californica TaxID=171875 RepID=UPI0035DAA796